MAEQNVDQATSLTAPDGSKPYVVGIGTSAGGLEALKELFENLGHQPNMAFVIVQHLSPDYKSLMVELLSKYTDMPVFAIEDGLEVVANTVYIIPPKKTLTIDQGKLYLNERGVSPRENFPIDRFFHSLGLDLQEKAIGVVLSGTGTDGSKGIHTIKEYGGLVIVQEPRSADFNGMPVSAIATHQADFILNPKAIAQELESLGQMAQNAPLDLDLYMGGEEWVNKIIMLLESETGLNLSLYKKSTFLRRTGRRLRVSGLKNIEEYYFRLRESHAEIQALMQDILIGVTHFFRDIEAFDILAETVLPKLFADKEPGEPIRVWVAACSTGEEAYSIAILIDEYQKLHMLNHPVKIFATDVNAQSLNRASEGSYPINIEADLSLGRLMKYFTKKQDAYVVISEIRNQIVFAPHNILVDPPFNRLDLTCCRNMLIYMENEAQDQALAALRFGLQVNRFLFLGPSESLRDFEPCFRTINKRWKIYQNTERVSDDLFELLRRSRYSQKPLLSVRQSARVAISPATGLLPDKTINRIKSKLLDRFSPPLAFVNDRMEVLFLSGGMNRYLRIPDNYPSIDLLKMLPEELATPLATLVQKVRREREPLLYKEINFRRPGEEHWQSLDIMAELFSADDNMDHNLVISFHVHGNVNQDVKAEIVSMDEMVSQRIEYLEQQVSETREKMQAVVEEFETSNEELMAANEELQSTNEELQSVNEELYAVNSELQAKIGELTEVSSDMDNFLHNSEVDTIFLDREMRIRKFTKGMARIFGLIEQDVGRYIDHFKMHLSDMDIGKLAKSVLKTEEGIEREIVFDDKQTVLLRILPYRGEERLVTGVLVMFINVEEFKNRLLAAK